MDKQFTLKLQEWLNTPAEKRDLEVGATLLLQLTNNKILYRNIKSNLKGHADFIEFKLKRYLQYRLQELTHEEVEAMQKQVDGIVSKFALDKAKAPSKKGKAPKSEAQEWKGGKRADHDTLPAEIQALYVENASIMQKMRELHLQLRTPLRLLPARTPTAIHSSKRLSNWISGIIRIGRLTTASQPLRTLPILVAVKPLPRQLLRLKLSQRLVNRRLTRLRVLNKRTSFARLTWPRGATRRILQRN